MTEYKICTYKACKDVFERPESMSDGTWNQISRCPDCRVRAHNQRSVDSAMPDTHLGRYEVNNETIDRFLYG